MAQTESQQLYQVEGSGIALCDALLAAGLGDKVLFPANASYEISIAQYYAINTRKRPWCIFQPNDALDISSALVAINHNQDLEVGGVAIRSGGHAAGEFASGIVNGVTFDLGMMNRTSYDPSTKLASIQPGARWGEVYTALSPHNVTVTGGRDAHVGVGGLLLGGGISYYASRVGMSCDTVVNYEVVLANGSIVNANQTHSSGLWKALKGGTNNFGLVTRFDKSTIPGQNVWFSQRTISSNYSRDYVNALVKFTHENNADTAAAVVGFVTHEPSTPGVSIILEEVNTLGIPNSTIFEDFNRIPANESTNKVETLAKVATEYPGNKRGVGSSLTFKNNAEILQHAVQLHTEYVEYLTSHIGSENFTSTCFFEPIPAAVQQFGARQGGNMLGLPAGQDVIIWDAWTEVSSDDAHLAITHAALRHLSAQISEFAHKRGGNVDLVYANYADASQDVIRSYPAENKKFMKAVADAYDPKGFFQKWVTGGFKLERSQYPTAWAS